MLKKKTDSNRTGNKLYKLSLAKKIIYSVMQGEDEDNPVFVRVKGSLEVGPSINVDQLHI